MKKIVYIALLFLSSLFTGCLDSFDDIKPNNKVPADDVWKDPASIKALLAGSYNRLIIEDFNYFYGDYSWRCMDLVGMSDEGCGGFQKEPAFDQYGGVFEYPDDFLGSFIYIQGNQGGEGNIRNIYQESYALIRNCNDILGKMDIVPLEETEKEPIIGELKFLRAMAYFTLVKRFGGVPLIDKAQEYTGSGSLPALQEPRATEEKVYDFIIQDCKDAAKALPPSRAERGRATRGAALALCSRAALYAGSIARYGTLGFGKLTGIDAARANDYYEIAYQASQAVMRMSEYKLFEQIPDDRTKNFNQLFVTLANGEYIFEKLFDVATGLGNSYDKKHLPFSYCRWGAITPTLEMVEAFEYIDGSKGTMRTGEQYEHIHAIFEGKDPRFLASIYVPGDIVLGSEVQFQRGIIKTDGSLYIAQNAPGASYYKEYYTDPVTGKEYELLGKDGGTYAGDASKTGFYIRKFVDENVKSEGQWEFGKSETPFPVFRLAEMYLNLAEAAVELNKYQDEAFAAIKALRDRAGIKTPFTTVDVEKVRQERRVELAFEGHRFWDMKRWHIAHLDASQGGLSGFRGEGLHPYFDIRSEKYEFRRADDLPKRQRIFSQKNYYTKFNTDDMNSNPSLIQNPGYIN